jgi:hypothetical protein
MKTINLNEYYLLNKENYIIEKEGFLFNLLNLLEFNKFESNYEKCREYYLREFLDNYDEPLKKYFIIKKDVNKTRFYACFTKKFYFNFYFKFYKKHLLLDKIEYEEYMYKINTKLFEKYKDEEDKWHLYTQNRTIVIKPNGEKVIGNNKILIWKGKYFYVSHYTDKRVNILFNLLNNKKCEVRLEDNQGHGYDFYINNRLIGGTGYPDNGVLNEYYLYLK